MGYFVFDIVVFERITKHRGERAENTTLNEAFLTNSNSNLLSLREGVELLLVCQLRPEGALCSNVNLPILNVILIHYLRRRFLWV